MSVERLSANINRTLDLDRFENEELDDILEDLVDTFCDLDQALLALEEDEER